MASFFSLVCSHNIKFVLKGLYVCIHCLIIQCQSVIRRFTSSFVIVFLQFGNSPLWLAASWGNAPMVEFLLRKGANVNEINKVIVLHACQHSSSTLFSTGRENYRGLDTWDSRH